MTDVPQFIQSILFQADIIITNHDTWFPCQFAFRYAVWGIERSGFFNGQGKWAKGFENQMV